MKISTAKVKKKFLIVEKLDFYTSPEANFTVNHPTKVYEALNTL